MHTQKITSHSVKNMDCRKGMQEIADNSISVVITDPLIYIKLHSSRHAIYGDETYLFCSLI